MQSAVQFIVEPVGVDVEKLSRPLSWPLLFGNDRPVELEIGSGKGTFLTQEAKLRPDTNFLGIEYANWYWRCASDRLRRNGCLNVRMVRAEAAFFVREFIADQSLAAVHIYFPDPWPKTRHHKRRLIQPPFALELHRILQKGGILRVATDHAEYFAQIQEVLAASPLARLELAPSGPEVAGTNFERKYRKEGRAVFAMAAIRA